MGDRTSIQFVNDDEKSPVLYAHWGGTGILDDVDNFMEILKTKYPTDPRCNDPITRHEPTAVLVMFMLKYVDESQTLDGCYRLEDSEVFYSNNDNGHWIVDLKTMTRHERRK